MFPNRPVKPCQICLHTIETRIDAVKSRFHACANIAESLLIDQDSKQDSNQRNTYRDYIMHGESPRLTGTDFRPWID